MLRSALSPKASWWKSEREIHKVFFLNLRSVRLCLLRVRVVTALVAQRFLIPWSTPMVPSLDQAFAIPTAAGGACVGNPTPRLARASLSHRSGLGIPSGSLIDLWRGNRKFLRLWSLSFPELRRDILWTRRWWRRRPWLDEKGKGPPKIGIVSVRPPPVGIRRVIRAVEGSGTAS